MVYFVFIWLHATENYSEQPVVGLLRVYFPANRTSIVYYI